MLFYAVFQSFFFRDRADFWSIKLKGILLGEILIPIIFYTYNGAIGKSPDWFNIAIFFIAAAITYIYEAKLLKSEPKEHAPTWLSLTLLFVIALAFVFFTFDPPTLGLFKDPIDGTFGI